MNPQLDIFGKLAEYFRPSFFNTIHLPEPDLKAAKAQTGLQDQRVMAIFREKGKLTPVEAWEAYCQAFPACPLTSIRRSITVLTGRGLLRKLPEMKAGRFGKPNYVWSV